MKLHEIFNIEFPIFQGGMAQIATGEFAAAVSNAGAMGVIGTGAMNADMLKREIETARKLTDKPFGVNLMLMNPDVEKMAKLLEEEKPALITTGAGNPGIYIEKWKKAGIKVFPVVSSVALARRLEKEGIDGVIAEGMESGGHIGDLTSMVLIPQIADALNIPVVAAGGIAIGRQMRAAEILGACGVQVGTILLASEECPIHENYKNEVIRAKDRSTVVTGMKLGIPVRCLKNAMTREYLRIEQQTDDKMELEKFTLGALRKAVEQGDVENGSLMAGQVAAFPKEVEPLRRIFENLMSEYEECLKKEEARDVQ